MTLTKSIQKHYHRKRCQAYQEASGDISADIIEKVIIDRYSSDLFKRSKKTEIVDPRQKAQFITYAVLKYKGMILQKIADRYGQKHENVIHSCDAVATAYTTEETYRDEMDEIGRILNLNMHDLVFEYIKYKRRNKV